MRVFGVQPGMTDLVGVVELLVFVLVAYGLTQILCFGSIFETIRPRHRFFHCSMCVGFWVGVFLFTLSPYTSLFSFDYSPVTGFLLGCLSSGTSYVACTLFGDEGLMLTFKEGKI